MAVREVFGIHRRRFDQGLLRKIYLNDCFQKNTMHKYREKHHFEYRETMAIETKTFSTLASRGKATKFKIQPKQESKS